MTDEILILFYVTGGIGLALAVLFSFISKSVKGEKDSEINRILGTSPNLNCGLCGFESAPEPGSLEKCRALDKHEYRPSSHEKMDKSSVIYCKGGSNCKDKYIYKGIETCLAADNIFRGAKSCVHGCLALGDCARACPSGAITYKPGEVPVVDKQKCRNCGTCVKACPKNIISLVTRKYDTHIRCSSVEKGRMTREICSMGCIVCGICVKICPTKAITIKDNLAKIDYASCTVCGLCVEKCPTNTIEKQLQNSQEKK